MYPVIRMAKEILKFRNAPALPITGTHVSQHICWPWDIDLWMELNNGRTLTLFDLGRIPLAIRTGLWDALKRNKWGIVVAGNTTRYRRRVQAFQKIEMRSRCLGWDDRWIWLEHAMFTKDGECTSHVLIRGAVTSKKGMIPPAQVLAEMGQDATSPPLPEFVTAWAEADHKRPWPPQM
ncbi:acyl-CoA thioesterase [Thioclava sp. F36-6]|uniref:acyl-CoA thioesterase n=1 Tax=Thioclava sp. F36-6 TaxID=1915316 RepID=UPI00099711FE|nr:acyl-CoA thioesterase [Thioclava sp. F36-6]OOY30026.1 thioeseterase [Thioclava sp. F36-6]